MGQVFRVSSIFSVQTKMLFITKHDNDNINNITKAITTADNEVNKMQCTIISSKFILISHITKQINTKIASMPINIALTISLNRENAQQGGKKNKKTNSTSFCWLSLINNPKIIFPIFDYHPYDIRISIIQ